MTPATQAADPLATGLDPIAELIAAGTAGVSDPMSIEAPVRASLACIGFGALTERAEVPPWLWAGFAGPASMPSSMVRAKVLATLGAAADLDPLDRGPAHLALPVTVAAFVLGTDQRLGAERIMDAIGVGIECGARLRRAVSGVRPGIGFHSVSTFGLYAATAASARVLGLGPKAAREAMAIALTRTAGLAVNGAATRIGMTHFGLAASHGIEAASLAAEGWTASHRLDVAFLTLFGEPGDAEALRRDSRTGAAVSTFFKHYPCNIYLNPAVRAVAQLSATAEDDIELTLPPVRHLDNPVPTDLRELRNSAQGAIAAAVLHGTSYRAFTRQTLHIGEDARLADLMRRVSVRFDTSRPTSLDTATVDVRVGGRHRQERLDAFGPLAGADLVSLSTGYSADEVPWLRPLIAGDYLAAYQVVTSTLAKEDS